MSAEFSIPLSVLGLGEVAFRIEMAAHGRVRYRTFPNASSDYSEGEMEGTLRVGGLSVLFAGSSIMQGETSGSSASNVLVELSFEAAVELQADVPIE